MVNWQLRGCKGNWAKIRPSKQPHSAMRQNSNEVSSITGQWIISVSLTNKPYSRYSPSLHALKNSSKTTCKRMQQLPTTRNNIQLGVQTDATCSIQQCWHLLANNVVSVCTGLNGIKAMSGCFSWEKQVRKFANVRNRGRVCLFYPTENDNGKL